MRKEKLVLILYQLLFVPIILVSVLRENYFTLTLEEFQSRSLNFTFMSTLIVFLFYLILIFFFKKLEEINIKTLLLYTSPLLFALVLTPPFMSRDFISYFVPARNFVDLGFSPYEVPRIDNPHVFWHQYYPNESWYRDYSYIGVYGPVFTLISIFAAFFGKFFGTSLYITTIIYKVIQTFFFAFFIVFLSKLKLFSQSQNAVWVLLNPMILIHFVLEGHNTVFIMFFLVFGMYLLEKQKSAKSALLPHKIKNRFINFKLTKEEIFAYISASFSVLVKYFTAIYFPVFWFEKKESVGKKTGDPAETRQNVLWKFSWRRFFLSGAVFLIAFFLLGSVFKGYFIKFAQTSELYVYRKFCLYNCSPTVWLFNKIFGLSRITVTFYISIFLWVIVGFLQLFLKFNPFKYLFWVSAVFCFVFVSWLTPWYLLHPFVYGLIAKEDRITDKKYFYMALAVSFYAFMHTFGF